MKEPDHLASHGAGVTTFVYDLLYALVFSLVCLFLRDAASERPVQSSSACIAWGHVNLSLARAELVHVPRPSGPFDPTQYGYGGP
jgi:hypothetical protein